MGRVCKAKYDNKNLKHILTNFFQDAKLEEIEKRVLIASFDLCIPGKGKPAFGDMGRKILPQLPRKIIRWQRKSS